MNHFNYGIEMDRFKKWRQRLYNCLSKSKAATMDLLDALCGNQKAYSVVELSLSPLFRREYPSIYQAIEDFTIVEPKPLISEDEKETESELTRIILDTIPTNIQRNYHLFGIDTTPNPRQFSPTLSDKKFIYQPNSLKGNKPINIGHSYSWLCYLPDKVEYFDTKWNIPLSVKRVKSDDQDLNVANQQINKILNYSHFSDKKLIVIVGDSLYSQRGFIGEQVKNNNVVSVTRVKSNRVFYYSVESSQNSVPSLGHPLWYGDKFDLKNPETWKQPDDVICRNFTTKKGRKLNLTIKGWKNMLMRGTYEYKLHNYPFTLIQITVTDESGFPVGKPMWLIAIGERRHELSFPDIYDSYRQRFDLEHFFRFGKQRLLMNSYLTPETKHEENWFQLILIASVQLWNARHLAACLPRPWEKYLPNFKQNQITPSVVQRDFSRIIATIGTPAISPKPRGFSVGRKKGEKPTPRPRYQVIKKGKSYQESRQI